VRPRGLFALLDNLVEGGDSLVLGIVIGLLVVATIGILFLLKVRRDLHRVDEARRQQEEAKRREEEASLRKMTANRRSVPSH
jgi:hypothetical protein